MCENRQITCPIGSDKCIDTGSTLETGFSEYFLLATQMFKPIPHPWTDLTRTIPTQVRTYWCLCINQSDAVIHRTNTFH